MGLTGPPKKVEAKPLSEAAKGRLEALRGRVAAVRQQRQGPGPGQGQRQAPGQVLLWGKRKQNRDRWDRVGATSFWIAAAASHDVRNS